MKLLRKILFRTFYVIAGLLLLVWLLLSPIAKWVIEKNSVKWTGRKIEMKSLWINPLTASVSVNGLKMYEADQKEIFFSADKIYANITLYKAIAGNYEITEFSVVSPSAKIIQSGNTFNYDDLVKKFNAPEKDTTSKPGAPVKWSLLKLAVTNASLNYTTTAPQSEIIVDSLNIFSPGMSYNDPKYLFNINLMMRTGGKLKTDLLIDTKEQFYTANTSAKDLNLNFLMPYIKQSILVKSFNGIVNAETFLTGDMNKTEDLAVSGSLKLTDFSVVDTLGEKLTSLDNLSVNIDSINTANGLYNFNKISVIHPYANIAMYDKGFNYERIMVASATTSTADANAPVEDYTNVFAMMAHYIKQLTESYMLTNYKIDSLNIQNGEIFFRDYTLNDQFDFILDNANITSTHVDSKAEKIHVDVSSGLNKSGKLTGSLDLFTANMNNMDIKYKIENMLISDINPYSKFYVATPFINGIVYYDANTTIRDHHLKSSNVFRVEKIKTGSKTGNPLYDIPVRLAVSLLTDLKGNINLDIPVEGDLNDPKFKVWPIAWQVLKNIMLKAVTAPFRLLANAFGGHEDDYKEVPFYYLQTSLTEKQVSNLDKISKVLMGKPDMKVDLMQVSNDMEEAEFLAVFEMKKQYYNIQSADSLGESDRARVENLSVKDSLFENFVIQKTNNTNPLLSVQEKCVQFVGKEKLVQKIHEYKEKRNEFLQKYLVSTEKIPTTQLFVHNNDSLGNTTKNNIPRFVVNYNIAESDSTAKVIKQ